MLCEARTRVVIPLGGLEMLGPPLPQETKLNVASDSAAAERAVLFKLQAPNCWKTRDLSAK
jgi:hypothetical protein